MMKHIFSIDEDGQPIVDNESMKIIAVGDEVTALLRERNLTAGAAIDVLDYVRRKIQKEMLKVIIGNDGR